MFTRHPHHVVTIAAIAAASCTPFAHAGDIFPQPGDILISASDEDGFPNLFFIHSGHQGVIQIFPSESVPAMQLLPVIRADDSSARIYALEEDSSAIAYYSISTGGVEGGQTDTPPIVGSLGFDSFDNPIVAFEDPLLGFEDPLLGFGPGYINFNHPLMADDPSFDGFEDPLFGFEDPLLGFEDPLFGFTANSITLAYPNIADSFQLTVSGAPITQAAPYPRNWFIDPDEIPAGATAPLADRLAGIIVHSAEGRAQGLYRAVFSTDAITSAEMILQPLYSGGVFQDPNIVIDGMHVDPVIPGHAILTGTDFTEGRGGGQPIIIDIDLNALFEHRMNGESGWTFRDLIADQTRLLVLEHNQGLDQSRIVSIDRETGNRTVIIEDGQDFIDPTSIAIVVEQAQQASYVGFADSTTSGSLRAEIIEANGSSSPTEIYLSEGTYTLSLTGTNEDNAMTGDLDIHADIRIKGQGVNATIIDAAEIDRVFDVHPGASLLLEDLSVRNGSAAGSMPRGGNILANGTLVLIDCEIFGGETPSGWGGGGVASHDNFYAVRTSFRANTSGSAGGGFALYEESNATIDRSRINNNTAAGSNGGGAAIRQQSTASIINTAMFSNSANWNGGALAIDTSLAVDIRYCTITRNDSNESGSITGASGGGILFSGSTELTLASTVVADNLDDGIPNDVAGLSPTADLNLEGYCFFGTPVDGNYVVTGDTTGTTFGGNAQLQPYFASIFSIIGYQPAPGSPLIDSANPQVYPPSDQLGQPRPVNIGGGFFAIPDIGAIERQPLPCPADVTGDGQINLADLNLVLANFGQATSDGDTNDDNQVDLADLNAVLAAFGQACP